MIKALQKIIDALKISQPVIQIVSAEEKRVESYLQKINEQTLNGKNFFVWDLISGLTQSGSPIERTLAPL